MSTYLHLKTHRPQRRRHKASQPATNRLLVLMASTLLFLGMLGLALWVG